MKKHAVFLVLAGRPILSSTAGWMGDDEFLVCYKITCSSAKQYQLVSRATSPGQNLK